MDNGMRFRTCPNCRQQVNVNLPTCWNCGTSFYQPQYVYTQNQFQYAQPQSNNMDNIGMIVALIGLIMSAISVFLPYVSVNVFGYSQSENLFNNTSDAYIILALCVIDAIVLICRCRTFGIDTLVCSIILALLGIIHMSNMQDGINDMGDYSGFAKLEVGAYLLIIGALITFIGGISLCVNQANKR